jgi:non-specific serine/threonine protein kinase/serine/threonine-protein kinase
MDEDHPTGPSENLETTRGEEPLTETPRQIGPYRLLEKLGEGGMGEVWLAEQTEPVQRRVALKVIKQGMDTKQVVARFEAERQALAMMDHPAVAKVFDAGATPEGRPYFAMEHVHGVPITEFCDRHKLSNRERLELFMQVCEGVQHAHQKAIIHRDLKPTNVLVATQDGNRLPKIIDFGVAKATAQKLTEQTVYTQMGVLIGTPEYMSPEQAEMTGEDVDTRTDVYSLGVILYELLVGALPFDSKELRSDGFEGLRKKIREEEPHKPSTRLSTLGDRSTESAKLRRVDLPTLQRQLRGDLDWITMKALEKDRTRRYGSPMELGADVERHLNHQPVLASPPSTAYRARKFVRRHRLGVGVTAAAVLVLVAFAVTMAVQARRIAAERDTSERVSASLAGMLGSVDPETLGFALWNNLRERVAEVRRGRGATEEEIAAVLATLGDALSGVNATDEALRLVDEQILSPAGEMIERELADEPRIAGRLEHTLGETYTKLGLYEQAGRHAARSAEIRERALGAEHPDTLSSKALEGVVSSAQGRYAEAETLFRETLEMRRRVLGNEHPDTLESMYALATTYGRQERYAEAETLVRETLEIQRRVLGEEHPDTLRSMGTVATACNVQGRYREAETLSHEVLALQRRVLGEEHPDTLLTRQNLAHVYGMQGRYAEAEAICWEVLEITRRLLGEEHPRTLDRMGRLAATYNQQGRHAEAEAIFVKVLESKRRVLGEEHPDTLLSVYNLGCTAALRGDRGAALGWLRQVVEHGFALADWMANDLDLESLHGDPEFHALIERARENASAQRSE